MNDGDFGHWRFRTLRILEISELMFGDFGTSVWRFRTLAIFFLLKYFFLHFYMKFHTSIHVISTMQALDIIIF